MIDRELVNSSTELRAGAPPLAVDLDGTLLKTDTLHETLLAALKHLPKAWRSLLLGLLRGRAAFKRAVSEHGAFDPALLPFNEDVVDYLKRERHAGRRLGLFTAADQAIAQRCADHLGLFDVVKGSDGVHNVGGVKKLAAIRETFGERFAYAGNGGVDRPIFAAAERVVLVGDVARLRRRLGRGKPVEAAFAVEKAGPQEWLKAIRFRHWSKNILVFVAPVLVLQQLSLQDMLDVAYLFIAMGLLASATYLINDMLDLAADRLHPRKRLRPFAAGTIPIFKGAIAVVGLLGASAWMATLLPMIAAICLGIYLATTLLYSFWLKRYPFIDVVTLAWLFTLRVVAGSVMIPRPPSPWLMTFAMLFFLGLAMIKRYAELAGAVAAGEVAANSRGYTADDMPLLLGSGVAAGFSAVVIFTIYLIDEQYPRHIYRHPQFLWFMVPVLIVWLLRMWHLTIRGEMDSDPVVFALEDRFSLVVGVCVGLVLLAAWS